jgi:hypothetical protein
MTNHRASRPRAEVVSRVRWIGQIVAAVLMGALFVAGIWAMETEPPSGAAHGPAG